MLEFKRCQSRAFTLVELLTVIAIISLLIGLLLPAVGAVRKSAQKTATLTVLGSISTGLETLKADQRLGGEYPPSRSDADPSVLLDELHVESPYESGDIEISGAGLLLWALAGADLLGTPGFKVFRTADSTRWSQDTDSTSSGGYGAYALDADDQPAHPRSGPYVDIDTINYTRNMGALMAPDFEIPAEEKASGGPADRRRYPMFLDTFGHPILYWRADPAGVQFVDDTTDGTVATGAGRGIYHWIDNSALIDNGSSDRLRLGDASDQHRLDWGGGTHDVASPPPPGTFEAYILNENAQSTLRPQRADSYLLVSPGADGIYGSGDDVTNFQQHGR